MYNDRIIAFILSQTNLEAKVNETRKDGQTVITIISIIINTQQTNIQNIIEEPLKQLF